MLGSIKPLRYVHLTIYGNNPPGGILPLHVFQGLEKAVVNISEDWIKYANYSWILYTRNTPQEVYEKLIAQVPGLKDHNILTFYFDNTGPKSGQYVQMIWDWFNRPR
jgi:hypothetical protein